MLIAYVLNFTKNRKQTKQKKDKNKQNGIVQIYIHCYIMKKMLK